MHTLPPVLPPEQGSVRDGNELPAPPKSSATLGARNAVEKLPRTTRSLATRHLKPILGFVVVPNAL